ncbi:hypothetical protein CDD81_7695 [Ophiocordyceps australis]|uniref:LysM domain-containing protein n=1 Tax=Ophiocordyceps australis TaxID=1399860 RepID=A0A2C5Y2P8_9HYPO|nr:hypothetical protein CDD81_7695 [Ophiocordyceps australis]
MVALKNALIALAGAELAFGAAVGRSENGNQGIAGQRTKEEMLKTNPFLTKGETLKNNPFLQAARENAAKPTPTPQGTAGQRTKEEMLKTNPFLTKEETLKNNPFLQAARENAAKPTPTPQGIVGQRTKEEMLKTNPFLTKEETLKNNPFLQAGRENAAKPTPTPQPAPCQSAPTSVETPQPIQEGMVKNCVKFTKIYERMTCNDIPNINIPNFLKWNPGVGPNCESLQPLTHACTLAIEDKDIC